MRQFVAGHNVDAEFCEAVFNSSHTPCPAGATIYASEDGMCSCTDSKYYFPVAPEYMTLNIDHSFTSFKKDSIKTGSGAQPHTVIRTSECQDDSCNLAEFAEGEVSSPSRGAAKRCRRRGVVRGPPPRSRLARPRARPA